MTSSPIIHSCTIGSSLRSVNATSSPALTVSSPGKKWEWCTVMVGASADASPPRAAARSAVASSAAATVAALSRRDAVGEQVDVGVDGVVRLLSEGQDAERNPRVAHGNRQVHRGPVADLLAARSGGGAVEDRGEKDRAARGIEVEHFGRVGRQAE